MKANGLTQPGGEDWWSNGFYLCLTSPDWVFAEFQRRNIWWEMPLHLPKGGGCKGTFTCGKATELLLYLPATAAHLRQPARRTSQQSLAVAYFYALQGQPAASASSLANQATNRCSHPSLNCLTLHCHIIPAFKGHYILENQNNRIHCLAWKTRRCKRMYHPWQGDTGLRKITSKAADCIVVISPFVISSSMQGGRVRLLPKYSARHCAFLLP